MLKLEGLTKNYGDLTAVRNLSLHLEEGDIFGFIGPNGAGKTTTIRVLATLLLPTSGSAYIDGVSVVKYPKKVRGLVGYMPDFFGFYDEVKVWEYLHFFAAAFKIGRSKRLSVVDDVMSLTDLTEKRDVFVEQLSRGMKQRLCLAKTLIHNPKVLLLDEPASGLDPRARVEMKELLRELSRMGKTIFVSSHILTELSDLCNKIGIVEKGELLAAGPIEEIERQLGAGRQISIRVIGSTQRVGKLLGGDGNVSDLSSDGNIVTFRFGGDDAELSGLVKGLFLKDVRVVTVEERRVDLNDIFMHITEGVVS